MKNCKTFCEAQNSEPPQGSYSADKKQNQIKV